MDQKGIEVPSYDGAPEGLAAYKEAVLQYLMATETHKRYLVGPRLVQRLTGVAKALIRTQTLRDPQWLAHPRGAYNTAGVPGRDLGATVTDRGKQACHGLLLPA